MKEFHRVSNTNKEKFVNMPFQIKENWTFFFLGMNNTVENSYQLDCNE